MYKLKLNSKEVETLGWLADRGYFPTELYDGMFLDEGEDEPSIDRESTYIIPEHIAWSLLELRDSDSDAYLSCLGDPLLSKIAKLEGEIV